MRPFLPLTLLALATAILPAAQPRGIGDVPDAAPDAEHAAFILPEGFEISLWASEPLIRKPVQMNWDAQGRLWVVTSTTYPQIKPGEGSVDQVVVLEDTDGDGKADKSTVFAENLYIPTAVVPADGGCYVANATEIIFLKDTDDDGKADFRQTVLSGFGTEDTHHLVHTLRQGPDGQLHFNQSIYIHSHIETPYGVRRLMGGGIWEFRPETRKLEIVAKGLINPWGYEFNRWGQSFATDGAGSEGINYIFPGAVFATSPGAKRIIPGLNPGQPKHCGLEIVEDPHLPDDWQNSLITCDFRGNRVNRFVLSESGSGYISKQVEDVVASTHRGFRPVDVRTGPDGALYIADWYNPIIQHGEVDFRDPRRDHVNGRIWRLTAKGRPLSKNPDFAKAELPALLENLKSPRRWDRLSAKTELRHRDAKAAVAAVDSWAESLKSDDTLYWNNLLEAAWARETLNNYSPALLRKVLESPDHHIRAAGLGILTHRLNETPDALKLLGVAIKDENPQVRLWAVTTLRLMFKPEAFELALQALDKPVDNNIDFLLELTAREQADVWLPVLLKGEIKLNDNPKHLVYALKATGKPEALPPLLKALGSGKLSPEDGAAALIMAGDVANPEQLDELLNLALSGLAAKPANEAGEPPFFSGILDALIKAGQRKAVPAKGAAEGLKTLLASSNPNVASRGALLAGLWKQESAREQLAKWAAQNDASPALRQASVQGLTYLGGTATRDFLDQLAKPEQATTTRSLAIIGLSELAPELSAKRAVEFFTQIKTADEAKPVLEAFLKSKKLPPLLVKELDGVTIPDVVAVEGIRMVSTRGVQGGLEDAFRKAGHLKQMDKPLTPEEMQSLVAKVKASGDPARGEQIYRRQQLLCSSCHAIGESGGLIGPNLVSVGASAPIDYLIESLLEPSKKIKEGYHMTMVTTTDGGVYAGAIAQDSGDELIIRDAANQLHKIAKSKIAQNSISPVSMMPPGLTASLREDEFVDLVRFMSELGREGDYKIKPNRYVRTWRTMGAIDQADIDQVRHVGLPTLSDRSHKFPWNIVFSEVSGDLPLADVAVAKMHPWYPKIVQFDLQMDSAGSVKLKFSTIKDIVVVVDDHEIKDLTEVLSLDLKAGTHVVSILVTKPVISLASLRVELLEGAAKVTTTP